DDRIGVDRPAVLADVDRERDHFDAVLLDEPPHRDRRVQAAAVREHDSLGHCAPSYRPARADSLRATDRASVRSDTSTNSVSSPATVPSTPLRPDRSSADATTCADPGGVRSTTTLPECATSTTHSENARFRCSP